MLKILILAHAEDNTALRMYALLRKKYAQETLRLVAAEYLAMAPHWIHQLDDRPASPTPLTSIILEDGCALEIDKNTVIFNRLQHAAMPHFYAADPSDHRYAEMEMYALWLSWLHSLGDQVINPPSPRFLAGAGFSRIEWIANAIQVGVPVVSFELDSRLEAHTLEQVESLSIFAAGESILFESSERDLSSLEENAISATASALQRYSSCPILRISFSYENEAWHFNHADPIPEAKTDQQIQSLIRFFEAKAGLP